MQLLKFESWLDIATPNALLRCDSVKLFGPQFLQVPNALAPSALLRHDSEKPCSDHNFCWQISIAPASRSTASANCPRLKDYAREMPLTIAIQSKSTLE